MQADEKNESAGLSALLQLEAMSRTAETEKSLQFLIVNETRKLINYRQAFLFSNNNSGKNRSFQVEAASSISVVDQNAPYIDWLTNLVNFFQSSEKLKSACQLDANSCPEEYKKGWQEYSLPFVLWVPLIPPHSNSIGGLWLARETPWSENEITLVKHLCDTYSHAWKALKGSRTFNTNITSKRIFYYSVAVLFLLVLLIPVRMSALAPAEIVAAHPTIISAPLDGVISDIKKLPNTYVKKNETLFLYEDTNLRNQFELAEKSLFVTEAELKKTKQAAFGDAKSKSDIALLESQVELRKAELEYAEELLNQVVVRAPVDGLLIYTDPDEWIGKTARVGERVMEIADPEVIKLKIDLPVSDAIVLNENAEVDLFLDVSPLESLSAILTDSAYKAEITPGDILSYRLYADITETEKELRIGLQGTAKIYGDKVPLFFYLFRRPISSVRQYIGI